MRVRERTRERGLLQSEELVASCLPPIARMLGSDACCSFEALRYTVQSDFAALFSRIREQGVLTANDVDVLEAVDDSLRCVQISAAGHVAHNFPAGLLPEGLL